MAQAKRTQLSITITPALADRIEDYFHRRRFRTRKDAVIRLLDFALIADPAPSLDTVSPKPDDAAGTDAR